MGVVPSYISAEPTREILEARGSWRVPGPSASFDVERDLRNSEQDHRLATYRRLRGHDLVAPPLCRDEIREQARIHCGAPCRLADEEQSGCREGGQRAVGKLRDDEVARGERAKLGGKILDDVSSGIAVGRGVSAAACGV